MAAKNPRLGVKHPTVVPTNFEPVERTEEDDAAERTGDDDES